MCIRLLNLKLFIIFANETKNRKEEVDMLQRTKTIAIACFLILFCISQVQGQIKEIGKVPKKIERLTSIQKPRLTSQFTYSRPSFWSESTSLLGGSIRSSFYDILPKEKARLPLQIRSAEIKSFLLTVPASQKEKEEAKRKLVEYENKKRSIQIHQLNSPTKNTGLGLSGNSTSSPESIAPQNIPTSSNEWGVEYIKYIIEDQMIRQGKEKIEQHFDKSNEMEKLFQLIPIKHDIKQEGNRNTSYIYYYAYGYELAA